MKFDRFYNCIPNRLVVQLTSDAMRVTYNERFSSENYGFV